MRVTAIAVDIDRNTIMREEEIEGLRYLARARDDERRENLYRSGFIPLESLYWISYLMQRTPPPSAPPSTRFARASQITYLCRAALSPSASEG